MNCLHKADEIVHGDRNAAYGEPSENHKCTADLINAAMRKKYPMWQNIDAEDVCWFNVLQKISRQMHNDSGDGLTDVCGYAANIEIIRNDWKVSAIREQRQASNCVKTAHVKPPETQQIDDGNETDFVSIPGETKTQPGDVPGSCAPWHGVPLPFDVKQGECVVFDLVNRKWVRKDDHPPESSEYVTALAEAARKSAPSQYPYRDGITGLWVQANGTVTRESHPEIDEPVQSTHSTTQVDPGETVKWCDDCREDFCGCAALRIGPFRPASEASRPTCFCGSSDHSPLDCPTCCLPYSIPRTMECTECGGRWNASNLSKCICQTAAKWRAVAPSAASPPQPQGEKGEVGR